VAKPRGNGSRCFDMGHLGLWPRAIGAFPQEAGSRPPKKPQRPPSEEKMARRMRSFFRDSFTSARRVRNLSRFFSESPTAIAETKRLFLVSALPIRKTKRYIAVRFFVSFRPLSIPIRSPLRWEPSRRLRDLANGGSDLPPRPI